MSSVPVSSQSDGQILRFIFGGYVALDALIVILAFFLWVSSHGSRMARKVAGGFGKKAGFAAALFCLLMAAPHAEDASVPPVAPPMSRLRRAAADIAAPPRFPVTQALQKGRKCAFSRSALPRLGWGPRRKAEAIRRSSKSSRHALRRRYRDRQSRRAPAKSRRTRPSGFKARSR